MDKEVIIIGTGHVFDIGDRIKEIIDIEKPDIVALELDRNRLNALLYGGSKKGGNGIYRFLSMIQNIMAKKFGNVAGTEMITAYNKAKELMIPVACIDMDSTYIVNKIWNELSFKEKIILFLSLFSSIFIPKRKIKNEVENLDSKNFVDELGKAFPKMKELLIDKRNEYMVNNISILLENYDKILAVVGEGHVEGIEKLLNEKGFENKTYHLKDIM